MDEFNKLITGKVNSAPEKSPAYTPQGVVEHKFMLILRQYPNGKMFPQLFPLGSQNRPDKKRKLKKEAKIQEIGEEETY